MNIDSFLIDLEIIGQIKENDKLAICNTLGSKKIFVNQASYINSIYRKYYGYNRDDCMTYIEDLVNKIEMSSFKLIEGSFTDMIINLKNSINSGLIGLKNLKLTYDNDTEIIARLTIYCNKIDKIIENLNEYINNLNEYSDCNEVMEDINLNPQMI